jgi:hypothetical protein
MAIYIPAQIGGVRGLYRSIDEGNSWGQINDGQHQWGVAGSSAIPGDPRIYRRVSRQHQQPRNHLRRRTIVGRDSWT